MKPSPEAIRDLARALDAQRRKKNLSFQRLGQAADVDAGQACRICRGRFATFSQNVVRICAALDVPVPVTGVMLTNGKELDAQLQAAMLKAWDGSESGTEGLLRLLDAASRLRGAGPVERMSDHPTG